MREQKTWMDDLLEQVAAGKMLPQDALNQFFLHKREESGATLTQEDHAFLTAMDAAETAQVVAKWCARHAAALPGGIAAMTAISADLRRASFFHPGRRPPLVTGLDMNGKRVMLFSPADTASDAEYAEDCLRVGGSISGAYADPVFLPVFISALTTACRGHGLPEPEYTK
ncbi:MAG: hypothetical protein IKK57_11695 [Clostridia bacterium]|nr:hypothetical protein [Clostridia bacterium]